MATTLAALRAKLNYELGVDTDAEVSPYPQAQRNSAITDAYAHLWRSGIWKAAVQSIAASGTSQIYALTTIREAYRVEVVDTDSSIQDQAQWTVEEDGSGGYQLILRSPIDTGVTLRVRGWQPYISTFANDAAVDDLPAEYNRVPLLKAKAIIWRAQLARYARYSSKQTLPGAMNVTIEQLLGMIAAAEREFDVEAKRLAAFRPRTMKSSRVLST